MFVTIKTNDKDSLKTGPCIALLLPQLALLDRGDLDQFPSAPPQTADYSHRRPDNMRLPTHSESLAAIFKFHVAGVGEA